MNARRTSAAALVATVAASVAVGVATPAYAKGGGDAVRTSKACSTGTLKLKAKHDDGRIEVEAELDTNRNGQRWAIRILDNNVSAWKGAATTHAPSGSFSVEKRIANRAGTDVVKVRVARGKTVCSLAVRV
jgi:hypothetical protein